MSIIKTYKGGDNTAIIERYPRKKAYSGDKYPSTLYRVVFSADYDNNFIYHVVCFETLKDATAHVAEYPFFELQGVNV